MPQLFLSHLCGDEATFDFGVATATFLSHLCGDEDRYFLGNYSLLISKSPTR